MNTKALMVISAIFLGLSGISLTFFSDDLADMLGLKSSLSLLFQLMGGLYFGLAMINWTARYHLIGGIYSRPVAIGNLVHFVMGALALIQQKTVNTEIKEEILWILTLAYAAFALLFCYVFFTTPDLRKQN
jgi:Na+-driven multidrug efflux pump